MMSGSEEEKIGGKYFGICPSFHHSKACNCKHCPSSPGEGYMFCARGNKLPVPEKAGCLCKDCYVYSQFALEGEYFCREEDE
ncbi:DUF2769 domain-containing protein [Methanococcoides methylutens]|uniref:DUF2769 domain-containing protein n=1 Tax=Methanococcoides methylutens TaxID=2226 RepID=UPI001E60AE29|nr:DUF2769 domain-containing protein [Methanococcoides methylutens]